MLSTVHRLDGARLLFNTDNTTSPAQPDPADTENWDTVYTFNVASNDPDFIAIPRQRAPSSVARHVAVFDDVDNGVTLREVTITGFTESGKWLSNP